jgi:hypothetical protein
VIAEELDRLLLCRQAVEKTIVYHDQNLVQEGSSDREHAAACMRSVALATAWEKVDDQFDDIKEHGRSLFDQDPRQAIFTKGALKKNSPASI